MSLVRSHFTAFVDPVTGSMIMAAIVDASCSVTSRSMVGEMRAPRRLSFRERRFLDIERVRQMVDDGQQRARAGLAAWRNATDGNPAEAHAVIARSRPICRVGCPSPRVRWYANAILSAVSTASGPNS